MKRINVALVGLRFGGAFADIYKHHPEIETIGLYDNDRQQLKKVSRAFGIDKTYNSFEVRTRIWSTPLSGVLSRTADRGSTKRLAGISRQPAFVRIDPL